MTEADPQSGTAFDSTDPTLDVEIVDNQSVTPVDAGALSELARRILINEGILSASISILLTNDAHIHRLNREFLQHDWPTDVLTFPLNEADTSRLTGEIVLSVETARRVAREIGSDPRMEVALYLVHGLLHLCGYDDHDEDETRLMRQREADALAAAGLSSPSEPGTRVVPAIAEEQRP